MAFIELHTAQRIICGFCGSVDSDRTGDQRLDPTYFPQMTCMVCWTRGDAIERLVVKPYLVRL